MKTPLCELAEKWRSDKCPAIWHSYTPLYYELLKDHRISTRRVLEIGIGNMELMGGIPDYKPGASLFMWEEFFPTAEIIGLDIRPDVLINQGRIKSFACDTSNEYDWDRVLPLIGDGFDLIIDDGSHTVEDQLAAARHLVPLLDFEGVYCIEDVGANGRGLELLQNFPWPTQVRHFNPDIMDDWLVIIREEWTRSCV